jgi:acetoacetate decarboxylase
MSEGNPVMTSPGEIIGWPFLRISYPTDPKNIAALLPPGIDASDTSNVNLSIYCFPVPAEPEYGIVTSVDANYNGEKGIYVLGYGIDQESAIFISQELNGQPKYPCDITFYRMGPNVTASCVHQGRTFVEVKATSTGALPVEEPHSEIEWWIKSSRAVGGEEKKYDFPPHVVKVRTDYTAVYNEGLDVDLTLNDSPWDPIASLLPIEGEVTAKLATKMFQDRVITLEGPLNPDAFWDHADTVGGSRWPGTNGGPKQG